MKKYISMLFTVIFCVLMLSVNAVAQKTYRCPICNTEGAAARVCSGVQDEGSFTRTPCSYRNQNILGELHLGNCMLEKYYCKTNYYCLKCFSTSSLYENHMCWIIHTSVYSNNSNHQLYRSVCSTYLDMYADIQEVYFTE